MKVYLSGVHSPASRGRRVWDAELVTYHEPKSVHLKLDPEVYEFFKSEGRGHITRMQNVLKAYVRARQRQQAGKAKKRA